jgi:hypothetical protein
MKRPSPIVMCWLPAPFSWLVVAQRHTIDVTALPSAAAPTSSGAISASATATEQGGAGWQPVNSWDLISADAERALLLRHFFEVDLVVSTTYESKAYGDGDPDPNKRQDKPVPRARIRSLQLCPTPHTPAAAAAAGELKAADTHCIVAALVMGVGVELWRIGAAPSLHVNAASGEYSECASLRPRRVALVSLDWMSNEIAALPLVAELDQLEVELDRLELVHSDCRTPTQPPAAAAASSETTLSGTCALVRWAICTGPGPLKSLLTLWTMPSATPTASAAATTASTGSKADSDGSASAPVVDAAVGWKLVHSRVVSCADRVEWFGSTLLRARTTPTLRTNAESAASASASAGVSASASANAAAAPSSVSGTTQIDRLLALGPSGLEIPAPSAAPLSRWLLPPLSVVPWVGASGLVHEYLPQLPWPERWRARPGVFVVHRCAAADSTACAHDRHRSTTPLALVTNEVFRPLHPDPSIVDALQRLDKPCDVPHIPQLVQVIEPLTIDSERAGAAASVASPTRASANTAGAAFVIGKPYHIPAYSTKRWRRLRATGHDSDDEGEDVNDEVARNVSDAVSGFDRCVADCIALSYDL